MAGEILVPNTPTVTSEVFDDEVVVVNFDTGTYFSIQGAGVPIWRWIETGSTEAQILRNCHSYFADDGAEMDASVSAFLARLVTESIVVGRASQASPGDRPLEEPEKPSAAPFSAPSLNAYTDMQELLWLDPVHEVDESGWPAPAEDEA